MKVHTVFTAARNCPLSDENEFILQPLHHFFPNCERRSASLIMCRPTPAVFLILTSNTGNLVPLVKNRFKIIMCVFIAEILWPILYYLLPRCRALSIKQLLSNEKAADMYISYTKNRLLSLNNKILREKRRRQHKRILCNFIIKN